MTNSKKKIPLLNQEVGIVKEKKFCLGKPFKLESGELSNLEVIYETYGAINSNGNNCILICHALTGDHHAAGTHESSEKPGWWNHLIGLANRLIQNDSSSYAQAVWELVVERQDPQAKLLIA